MKPTISIITAVRNAASTIAGCIESIQAQTVPVEHIIIDGGSTDCTLEVIERYRCGIAQVVSEPDRGIYDAMNKGIALATGEIIGILNSDDFFAHPGVLAKVAETMADESIDSCYGDLDYVKFAGDWETRNQEPGTRNRLHHSRSKVIRSWRSDPFEPARFYWGWMPPHPTFFVRRRLYEQFGCFSLDLGSAADYELMLRFLVKHGSSSAHIPDVLVKMLVGGVSNASVGNRLRANLMDRKAWLANGIRPYPWTLTLKPLRKVFQWRLMGLPMPAEIPSILSLRSMLNLGRADGYPVARQSSDDISP